METETEDGLLARRPSLASSWDATCGALDQSLLVTRAGVGARDLERDELLAPPAPGCAWPPGTGRLLCDCHAPGGVVRGGGGREGRGSGPGSRVRSWRAVSAGSQGWRGRGARARVTRGPGRLRRGSVGRRGFWAGDLEKALDTHAGEPVRSALGCTCHNRNPPLSPSKQKAAVHLPVNQKRR